MATDRLVRERLWAGLGPRVMGLALLAVLVTGGLVGTILVHNSRSILRDNILSRNLGAAEVTGNLATSFVEGAETSLSQLSLRPLFVAAVLDQDLEQAEWHMAQVMQADSRFDNIAVYSREGIGWASGLGPEWRNRGGDVTDREWFQQTVATGAPHLGIPILSRGTGRPVISYVIPMLGEDGELAAVLAGGISLAALSDMVAATRLGEGTQASLIDAREGGLILADADLELILEPVPGEDEAMSKAVAGERGTLESSDSEGEAQLAAFAPVPRLPWSVLIREPAETAFAPLRTLTVRALLSMGAVLLVALVLSGLLAHRITRRLRCLAAGAVEVGHGNLDLKVDVGRKDEIGSLSRAFDHMSAELKTTLVSRDELAAEVAERAQAEEALREASERLSLATRAGGVGIWEFDVLSNSLIWDEEMFRLFGAAPHEFEGVYEAWSTRVHPDDLQQAQAELQMALRGEKEFDTEFRIVWPDGAIHDIRALARADRDDSGQATRVVGVNYDVTESKRAGQERLELERQLQQSQRLESLGVLAGGIAHDFNNILLAVLGNAEMALTDLSPSAPARENLLEITQASRRAAELCRQMLAYSGRGRFVSEVVDLGALIEDMVGLLKSTVSKKALLNLNLGKGLPRLHGDPSQLSQVIMNLVINASEAIGDRSGVITISTGAMECSREYLRGTYVSENLVPGLYLTLEVSDTGGGMDAETKARLFEPFFTTKFTGRGLGLSAVLGIVRGHKGALRLYSELGRGTTFKILLPAVEEESDVEGPLSKSCGSAAEWKGQGTVLLVDDEETIRTLGARMLSRLGFLVLAAGDGREALQLYAEHRGEIVLVLLDLTMPHMDGEETFRELRRLDPGVRVVMSSGYTEQDITSRFAGKGLVGFIQKPYTSAQLEERLRATLAHGNESTSDESAG